MAKAYSVIEDGDVSLSKYFKVSDFACPFSDKVVIDKKLVEILSKVRGHFKKKVTIISAYTVGDECDPTKPEYYHQKGMAVDFKVNGIDIIKVADYILELVGDKYGLMINDDLYASRRSIHLDVRNFKWRAIKGIHDRYTTLPDLFPTISFGCSGIIVSVLCKRLKQLGYLKTVKTTYISDAIAAVQNFQRDNELKVTGVCDGDTWKAIAKNL